MATVQEFVHRRIAALFHRESLYVSTDCHTPKMTTSASVVTGKYSEPTISPEIIANKIKVDFFSATTRPILQREFLERGCR